MTDPQLIDDTIAIARSLLHERFTSVRAIVTTTLLKKTERSLVLRCELAASRADAPATVIVKRMLSSRERGYTDWASLQFLGTTAERASLAPRFHAGDSARGIYIIEDLGGSESIDDLLRRNDREAAVGALMRLAERCAELGHATAGAEGEFSTMRRALPGWEDLGRHHEGERWTRDLERVPWWFTAAEAALDQRFGAECARLNAEIVEPGAFLSFTHGDIAPTNNHIGDGEVRLLDFEYGGYRHALYDMAVWNVLCPLPGPLLEEMMKRHGERWLGERGDGEGELAREWRGVCVWRGIAMLRWLPRSITEENRPWVEEWSARDAFLRTVRMIADCAIGRDDLPGIAGSFARLADALATRWSDAEGSIPRWSALA